MTKEELMNVKGGVSKSIIVGAVGAIITFLIGVFDGYFRPLSCNP